jgi:hypothetical protein
MHGSRNQTGSTGRKAPFVARTHAIVVAYAVSVAMHIGVLFVSIDRPHFVNRTRYSPIIVSIGTGDTSLSKRMAIQSSNTTESILPAIPVSRVSSVLPPQAPVEVDKPQQDAVILTNLSPIPPPTPIYFTRQELHQPPIPLSRVLIEEADRSYPDSVTTLSIFISSKGTVDRVEVMAADDTSIAQEFAAQFLIARFLPGKISGVSVNSEFRVEVVSQRARVFFQPVK